MADKDAVRRGYDELAETYAAQRSEDGRGMGILSEFLDSLSRPTRVLDGGCGQGTPVLRRLGDDATATGVDFSREQLRLATENVPDAALVQGDLTDLPFDDGVFDAVVAYWSLIHVPMGDHQAVVDEFARVVRPGGRLLVCEGTTQWVGENPDWLDSGVEMQWEIAGAEATREQLHDAGFEIVDSWGVPETLEGEESQAAEDDEGNSDADDEPWTFFAAQLGP